MQTSFNTISPVAVHGAYAGEKPLQAIYAGERKVWPQNEGRLSAIRLDFGALSDLDALYLQHALDALETQAAAPNCHIKFHCGQGYYVNAAPDEQAVAYHDRNGRFEFDYGTGPLSAGLRPGATVGLDLIIPSRAGRRSTGTGEGAISELHPACLPGTTVCGYFVKAYRNIASGLRVQVESLPDQAVLLDRQRQQTGTERVSCLLEYGTADYTPGQSQVRLTLTPVQYSAGEWGAYFQYPAFKRSLSLPVIGTESEEPRR